MEELLSLKWNNHRSTFLHILAVLRDKQLFTDATIACDGKLYGVHKLVLSTCSDYFSSMLDRTACKSPVIVLKDIKSGDLEALLDYMYLGEVNVRQSDLATLIKAAECLRVKGLAVPDDEIPPPRKSRGSDSQPRRVDTSSSPPAKRKRRSDVDDGRDDVRPVRQDIRQSSPVHSSSRPKTPLSNSHPSNTLNKNSINISSSNSTSFPSNSLSDNLSIVPSNNNSVGLPSSNVNNIKPITDNNTNDPVADDYPSEAAPCVKVEMIDDAADNGDGGGGGLDHSSGDIADTYNPSNDDFKEEEEEDDTNGTDLGGDLPEFLQQATANYSHSSFAGPSFQPDLSWQGGDGGGGNMAGSFAAGLSFGGQSSQDGGHNSSTGRTTSASSSLIQQRFSSSLTSDRTSYLLEAVRKNSSAADSLGGLNSSLSAIATNYDGNRSDMMAREGGGFLDHGSGGDANRSSFSDLMDNLADGGVAFGQSPYGLSTKPCSLCGKSFASGWELKRHLNTHMDKRPYICLYCNHRSNFKHNLKAHVKIVHKDQPFGFTVDTSSGVQ